MKLLDDLPLDQPVRFLTGNGVGLLRTVEEAIDYVNQAIDSDLPTRDAFIAAKEPLYVALDSRAGVDIAKARELLVAAFATSKMLYR